MTVRDIMFQVVLIGCEEHRHTGHVGYKLHRIWSAIWFRLNKLYNGRVKIGQERFSHDAFRRQLNVPVEIAGVDFSNMTERGFKSRMLDGLPLKADVLDGIIKRICVEKIK